VKRNGNKDARTMARTTLNFIIDLATTLVMLAMISTGLLVRFVLPPGSGDRMSVWNNTRHEWGDVHFWLAVTLGAFVLIHLALHWGWVCSLVARWFRSTHTLSMSRSALRRNLMGGAVLAATALLITGFLWSAQRAIVKADGGAGQFRGGRQAAVDIEKRSDSMEASDKAKPAHDSLLRGSMTLREASEHLGLTPHRIAEILDLRGAVSPD
jgi:hypothetical protein